MNKKATDIVSYITIIGWLVAYFAGTKEESRFHLNQGLVLFVVGLVVSIVTTILDFIPIIRIIASLVSIVWSVFAFACMIIGIVNAASGHEKPLPLIGGIQLLKTY